MTAQQIVDILLEGTFSPDEMDELVSKSMYHFNWHDHPSDDKGNGTYRCEFQILLHQATGTFYVGLSGYGQGRRIGCNYSMSFQQVINNIGYHGDSRLHTIHVEGTPAEIKSRFEDFVRGPLTALAKKRKVSRQSVTAANTKFRQGMEWQGKGEKASPEEIEALQARFDYGVEKGEDSYSAMGMFDDPRVEGRETDYNYLTKEDVQFWNMMADEYDARANQPG